MVSCSNGQNYPLDIIFSFVRVHDITRLNAPGHRSLAFLNYIETGTKVDALSRYLCYVARGVCVVRENGENRQTSIV